jgi:hypothetical protein
MIGNSRDQAARAALASRRPQEPVALSRTLDLPGRTARAAQVMAIKQAARVKVTKQVKVTKRAARVMATKQAPREVGRSDLAI